MAGAHESDIPSITLNFKNIKAEECFAALSFVHLNSLAAAKRLTWEQTPWLFPKLEVSTCKQIASLVPAHVGQEVSWEALHNGLILGATYTSGWNDAAGELLETHPFLMVIFPHIKQDISRNETFLKLWHDDIVCPAFNRAWEDSGMVDVYGANKDFMARINLPLNGPIHGMEAHLFEGFKHHIRNGSMRCVRTFWPAWKDFWGPGYEGKHSDIRAKILDDAWKSIIGIIEGHPDLQEFQDPFLVAIHRARTDVNPDSKLGDIYQAIGHQWDQVIDSRFAVPGSFKVFVETVIGDDSTSVEVSDDDDCGNDPIGVEYKRFAEDEARNAGKKQRHGEEIVYDSDD